MSAKTPSPQFAFIVEQLQKNQSMSYADVSAAAQKRGLKIFPIMYGRAQAMLGLVESAKRGSGKAARKTQRAVAAAAAASPSATPKAAPRKTEHAPAGIDSIIAHVKAAEFERERYREAIEKIRLILDELA